MIDVLSCPSDPNSPKIERLNVPSIGFQGNYVLCGGNEFFNDDGHKISADLNGIAFAGSKVPFGDIIDGLSQTAMASEINLTPDWDMRGAYYNPAHSGVMFSTRLPPNDTTPDHFNLCSRSLPELAPCTENFGSGNGGHMFVLARSNHSGGVNLSMADGSTQFVSDSIDAFVYLAMGSRNGEDLGVPSTPP